MVLPKRNDGGRLSNGLSVDELGRRVRTVRQRLELTLQEVADAAQVSRSMLSEIERGAKVPTVLVLDRVAGALGTSIAQLLDEPRVEPAVVLRSSEQRVERDSGWTWRLLSPALPDRPLQIIRAVAPPAGEGPEFPAHAAGSREWIAVERGRLRVAVGEATFELDAGDSVSYVGDLPHRISNLDTEESVYFLVIDYTSSVVPL